MHFNQLFKLSLLLATAWPTTATVLHNKKCSNTKCYKRLEHKDHHGAKVKADCKSYQKTTVIPCPQTVTKYTTATTTTTTCPHPYKRHYEPADYADTLAPRSEPPRCYPQTATNCQPDYANRHCKGSEYASACSCLGVSSGKTVTLPESTSTKTETVSTTTITEIHCLSTTASTTTASTTTASTTTSSTTTSSSTPAPTACSPAQSSFCTAQNSGSQSCLCFLDADGSTPICSDSGICPQSAFPNPQGPCASDADCALYYPDSPYTRCVYDYVNGFCLPTYCASEANCLQQQPSP